MTKFHNPYHFVPVSPDEKKEEWKQKDVFIHGNGGSLSHWSHKRYDAAKDVFHGRVICKLTTESPIFIGAKRMEKPSDTTPAEVAPFELDEKPAIPASSLRGLISSIAEAASNSALRVLEDRALSFRANVPGLSAIGMIFIDIENQGKKSYRLQPLVMPTLENNNAAGYTFTDERYKKMFFEDAKIPRLRVLIGKKTTRPSIENPRQKIPVKTFTHTSAEYYYMNLRKDWGFINKGVLSDKKLVRNPSNRRGPGYDARFCIGQRPLGANQTPIPECDVTEDQKKKWTRGIVRILDTPSEGGRCLPQMRKHELFIPYPQNAENWLTYSVPDEVVETFHKLADERTDATKNHELPYEPYGTLRNTSDKQEGDYFRLKHKDLVYFLPSESGDTVAEIALSAIWRRGPKVADNNNKLATVHNFFGQINPECLPYNKERNTISPAEMVFGFVEDRKKDDGRPPEGKEHQALAYAGRVRFSHGIWQFDDKNQDPYLPAVTLKILDSPKPPSPALYFTMKEGAPKYIAKMSLDVKDHKPQGRKFYLHKFQGDNEPWRSRNITGQDARLKQKVRITPIPSGRSFWFHIDFDNLNEYELGMLLYSLRPDTNFCHKIGMGKPLGLGSVWIEPVALKLIDRQKRYLDSELFSQKRYAQSLIANFDAWQKRPVQYAKADTANSENVPNFSFMRASFENTIQPKIGHALKMLGNPENVKYPVHTPLQENQVGAAAEKESYKWFTKNDGERNSSKQQALKPINLDSLLPDLSRN